MYVTDKNRPTGTDLAPQRLRALILALYVGYPAGCLLQLLVADDTAVSLVADMAGLALVVGSVVAFFMIARTSVQRVMHVPEAELDERERQERWRAHQSAYATFCGLAVAALIYMALAIDFADRAPFPIWRPTTYEHWSGLVWAGLLLALTLPTAFHAFASANQRADEAD